MDFDGCIAIKGQTTGNPELNMQGQEMLGTLEKPSITYYRCRFLLLSSEALKNLSDADGMSQGEYDKLLTKLRSWIPGLQRMRSRSPTATSTSDRGNRTDKQRAAQGCWTTKQGQVESLESVDRHFQGKGHEQQHQ